MEKSAKEKTVLEDMIAKGYSRRDFMKFSAMMAAFIGVGSSAVGQVVNALEIKKRPPVLWMHFQECTGCTESFIRSSHPIVADILLDNISLNYSETLQAASGFMAEKSLHDTIKDHHGEYILCIEGSVPTKADGVYCCIGGKTSMDILEEVSAGAKAIIAWGSCASNGGIQSAKPNPTGTKPIQEIIQNKTIINVPGCPPIGEVMAGVIVHILAFDRLPQLDSQGRPKAFYSRRVHDTCYRRPNYDAGLFAETWDDENAKKGYCLYDVGCRGPVTYNACGVTRWNNGVSFPIQSGHPCIGCSENDFWDNGPFYERISGFPGFGIESNADKIGLYAGAATAAGIAVHAIATNVQKNRIISKTEEESSIEEINE